MNVITLIISKLSLFILRLLKRGSNYPGVLALSINKKITKYFKMPKLVVAVTGSSGKGSTSSMIADSLRLSGMKVVHNRFGSNMMPGVLTLLISSSKLNGQINADALIVEVDERNTKEVFKMIKPDYVVVTNITRDQPPRHGNFDLVFDKINEALDKKTTLVLNGDDPYLRKFNIPNTIYYGINKNKYSYKTNKFNNINIYYCPLCNTKLKYNYYHFEALGDYYCPNCEFKRKVDYLAKLDLDNSYMLVNNNRIDIQFNVLYYAYNILACYTVLNKIGIEEKDICKYISSLLNNKKLNDTYTYNNKQVYVMNNKAENSTTFNESVLFTYNHKGKKIIVVGWKEISRRYEFNDMSWMYDIEFELLNNSDTKYVLCVGRDKENIALRMKYAGFSKSQIKMFDSLEDAKDLIVKSKYDVYGILNFDYIDPFNELFGGNDD